MKRQDVAGPKNLIKKYKKKNAPAPVPPVPRGDLDCTRNQKKIFSFTVEVYPSGNTILFVESTQGTETGERTIKTLWSPSTALRRGIEREIIKADMQHKALVTDKDAREWENITRRTARDKRDKNLTYLFESNE